MLLPIFFVGLGKEWGGVRNYQIAWTGIIILVLALVRRFDLSNVSKSFSAVCIGLAGLSIYAVSITRYLSFKTSAYNFSLFELMLWNTSRGRFMYTPVCDCNHFAVHVHGILLPLALLFDVFQSHWFLLLLHPAVVIGAGLVFHKLALGVGASRGVATLATLTFFNLPYTGSIVTYHFQPEVFYLLFGFLLIGTWQARSVWFVFVCLLIWTVKEEAGIYTAFFALAYIIFGEQDRRRGACLLLVMSLLVFVGMNVWLLPEIKHNYGDVLNYDVYWQRYGSNLFEVVWTLFTQPWLAIVPVFTSNLYQLFGAALFVPLLHPRSLLPALAGIFVLGLSSKPSMRQYSFYHSCSFLAFFCWAHIQGTVNPYFAFAKRWAFPLGIAGLMCLPLWGPGYLRYYVPELDIRSDFLKLAATFEDDAKVCLQDVFWPHAPFSWKLQKLTEKCLAEPDTVGIAHPRLSAYPLSKNQLSDLLANSSKQATGSAGIVIVRGRP